MAPSVSVILPAFNRARSIGRAIDSVFAQSFGDFELIVVDDASTDDTQGIVASYDDNRLIPLAHEYNRGAAAARNTGAAAATGKWLAFLDSDDVWAPQKLALQLEQLDATECAARASCTGYEVVSLPDRWEVIPGPVTRDRLLLWCDLSPGSTLIVLRDLFREVGPFDETWPRYEDWDWILRCERLSSILVVPSVLATIYYNPKRPAAAVELGGSAFIHRYRDELLARGRLGRKALSLRWLEIARYHAMEHHRGPFLRYLARAFRTYALQRPGSLLLIFDAWFGTRCSVGALRMKAWFSKKIVRRKRRPYGVAG